MLQIIIEKYNIEGDSSSREVLETLEKKKVEYQSELAKCLSRQLGKKGSTTVSSRSSISSIAEIIENQRRHNEISETVTDEIIHWKQKLDDVERDIRDLGGNENRLSTSITLNDTEEDYEDCSDSAAKMDGCELRFYSNNKDNKFKIMRPVYTQKEFDLNHGGSVDKLTWKDKMGVHMRNYKNTHCTPLGVKDFVLNRVPFIMCMLHYKWRSWILADIVAGLIVGVMQIPQGMGYALLAGVEPQYGLYVSFFPSVSYFLFGTSRHVSMGTVAIVSLLSGNFLLSSVAMNPFNVTMVGNTTIGPSLGQLMASRAAGLTLCVGLIHFLMGICQLGFITRYLSDPLVSGFTVGAAISVLTSQITSCLGLTIPKQTGNFNIPLTYYQVILKLPTTNMVTLTLTLICIAILIVTKEWINPKLVKKIKIPIPMDLVLVVCGTVLSYFLNLTEKYQVKIIGTINKGLPAPALPDIKYLSSSIADIFITAIISFSISVSLAKIFAKKHNYPIDPNQECLAYGLMNVFSSFFLCYTAGASLSRSAVQESIGGKTQLTSIIASVLVFFVLLFIGPLFYSLPICILSAIIVVALKGMFMQFVELKELWIFSLWDFTIWTVTFLLTVIIDIAYGLIGGVALSILIVMLRTQSPNSHILGQIVGTDLYKNRAVYDECKEIEGIKIFRYEGSLYYASGDHFRNTLYKKVTCDPRDIGIKLRKIQRKIKKIENKIQKKSQENPEENDATLTETKDRLEKQLHTEQSFNIRYVIIDCSTWGYIDTVGVKILHQVIDEYKNINVTVLLANPKTDIRKMFARSKCFKALDDQIIYVSVHDAVINCLFDHKMKAEEQETET